MCADTRAAYYTPYLLGLSTLTPRYGCVCGDETIVSGAPTLCGLGQFYAYSHSVAAAASAFPKRKRAHERILAQKRSEVIKERNWDCPTGMRACNIDGVANSWEVSTRAVWRQWEELGADFNVLYISALTLIRNLNHAVAAVTVITVPMVIPPSPWALSEFRSCLLIVDSGGWQSLAFNSCTALPGVLRGSVTCSDGKCEAFACKRGWTLRDRECVKTFTFQL